MTMVGLWAQRDAASQPCATTAARAGVQGTRRQDALAVLLVVVENLGDRDDSGVLRSLVGLAGLGLVPVHDAADEGRDEGDASLGAGDGLAKAEEEGEVAVDVELLLEVASGLDALPGRGNLDEDAVLGDANRLVESDEGLGLKRVFVKGGQRRESNVLERL